MSKIEHMRARRSETTITEFEPIVTRCHFSFFFFPRIYDKTLPQEKVQAQWIPVYFNHRVFGGFKNYHYRRYYNIYYGH